MLSNRVLIGILVALAGVGAVCLLRGGDGPVKDRIEFVCVSTGKTYTIARSSFRMLPVENPDTGQATLVPCIRRGPDLYVDAHYREIVEALEQEELNHYVDLQDELRVKQAP